MGGVGRMCSEYVKAEVKASFSGDMCYTVLFNVNHNLNNLKIDVLNMISTINHTARPP